MKPTPPHDQTRSPSNEEKRDFAARKFRWLEQVARDHCNLPQIAPVLCIYFCHLFDLAKGEGAWPWQDTLANALSVKRWAINRALAALIERGHLQSTRQGRDRPNIYHMVLADDDADGTPPERSRSAPAHTSSKARSAPAHTSSEPSEPHDVCAEYLRCVQNDDHDVRLRTHRLSSKTTPKTTGRKTLSPDVAALGGKKARKGLAAGRIKPEAEPKRRDVGQVHLANRDAEAADAFPRFWAVYPRHDNEERARKEFARATEDTDPEIIIAGAQRYALAEQMRLARPGQTSQHTAMAHNWLHDRRWNDPPPEGAAIIDQTGAVVAFAAAPGRKTETWMETVERRQRERAAGLRP